MLNAPLLSKTRLRLPPGALGVWDPANYVAATRTIPNEITASNPRSQNILRAPRGFFSAPSFGIYGGNNQLTVTDNTATAPDGSLEASTVTGGAGQDWFIQCTNAKTGVGTLQNGVQYTLAFSVKSLSGGSLNFKLGRSGSEAVLTATTSWQRFTVTWVNSGAGGTLMFRSPDSIIAANFAVCDFELFAGAVDLNPNPMTAKPQVILNRDIQVCFDGSSSVTGGRIIKGSSAILQLDSTLDVKNYTLLYVAKKNVAYVAGAQYEPILAEVDIGSETWNNFAVGPIVQQNVGQRINGNSVDKRFSGQSGLANPNQTADLFGLSGAGPFVAAHRFSGGNRATTVINGVQILDWTGSARTPNAVKDLFVGCLSNSNFTTYDNYFMVLYPRALTDAEIRTAQLAIGQRVALGSTSAQRVVIYMGSSITASLGSAVNNSYADKTGPNLVPLSFGSNWGFSGNALPNIVAQEPFLEDAFAGSPLQKQIVSFEIGANDLNVAPGALITTFLSNYAALCDRQRAKGRKVVVHTVLNRTDVAGGSANFTANRATVNAALATWVGVHCDALADVASDATIGTDAAPSNTTYFQDLVHPTIAGYVIWEPYTRAAINSV